MPACLPSPNSSRHHTLTPPAPPSQIHLNDTGSIMTLSWTADSTQLAGGGGSGGVVFGQVVDLALEDGKMQVGGGGRGGEGRGGGLLDPNP